MLSKLFCFIYFCTGSLLATPISTEYVEGRIGALLGMQLIELSPKGSSKPQLLKIKAIGSYAGARSKGIKVGDHITRLDGQSPVTLTRLAQSFGMMGGTHVLEISGSPQPEAVKKELKVSLAELDSSPKVGDDAPDFTLSTFDSQHTITLSNALKQGGPVALIFGSFTCGFFRAHGLGMEQVYQKYKDRVQFYSVYIREAHPSDGDWADGEVKIPDPGDIEERMGAAKACSAKLKFTFPMLVDTLDDSVNLAYNAWPVRVYVIDDKSAKVTGRTHWGPFGFNSGILDRFLEQTLKQK